MLKLLPICFFGLFLTQLVGQTPLYTPRNVQKAYAQGTRTPDGQPGPKYWQNTASYKIAVTLSPPATKLEGVETIEYTNHSPNSLDELNIKLIQNTHLGTTSRVSNVQQDWLGKGLNITAVTVNGKSVKWDNEEHNYGGNPTNGYLTLPSSLEPNEKVTLTFRWDYDLRPSTNGDREGIVDPTTFFAAYFFPRISVYDDLDGWDLTELNEQTEYFNDFGDFELSVDVPQHFLVWSTGALVNPSEVLQPAFVERLAKAKKSKSVVEIVGEKEAKKREVTLKNKRLIWKFKANHVSDMAFGVSDHYRWDGVVANGKTPTDSTIWIQTAYAPESGDYPEMANICRKVVQYYNSEMPGYPFPYPQLTAFNGLGQMEYPMVVNDNTLDNPDDVITLASHEIAHQYLPFYMGTNESRYAWMDEGWASFFEYHASLHAFKLNDSTATFPRYYQMEMNYTENADLDVPMYTPSNQQMSVSYGFNSYGKPAAAYTALKMLLGEATFKKCLHEYFRRWNGKHPCPHDFFYTFNSASGQDLNWFWKAWFFDYNTVNLKIEKVDLSSNVPQAIIVNTGGKPVPVTLEVTFQDDSKERITRSLEVWKTQQSVQIPLPTTQSITRLRIVQDWFYENDLTDNVWKK